MFSCSYDVAFQAKSATQSEESVFHSDFNTRGICLIPEIEEIKLSILFRCDLPGINSLMRTNIGWFDLSAKNWQLFEQKIKNFILNNRKVNDRFLRSVFEHFPPVLTKEIQKLAFSTKVEDFKQIFYLYKARDIFFIWEKARKDSGFCQNHFDLDVNLFDTKTKLTNKAGRFNQWCILNQPKLDGMNFLDLSLLMLTSFPAELGHCKKIQKLSLSDNEFTYLPTHLDQLVELKELLLDGNVIQSLPSEIVNLKALEILNISDNQLSKLSSNQLTLLFNKIGKIENLKILNCKSNKLISISSDLHKLTKLESLNLSLNQLFCLPEKFKRLANIKTLNLRGNQFKSIPNEIYQLLKLEDLNFSNNCINSLADEIGLLTNLKVLSVGVNRISSISKEIIKLTNLEILHLYENRLSSIPENIAELKNLELINLMGNPLTELSHRLFRVVKLDDYQKNSLHLVTIKQNKPILNVKNSNFK